VANQNGRPVAPARKLVAAVVGTIAVFVMLFGLGMSSWAIVAVGLAMLILAIALGMVNVVRRGARAWVAGTAQVQSVSEPPATAIYGRAELKVVIVAPGLPTSEVTVRDPRVPVVKWPRVGDTLPVTVDVDDMRRVRINWDEAETYETTTQNVPPAYYEEDLPDDDLLGGEPEPPPWATRDRQWGRGPDEPPPPPSPRVGDLDGPPPPPPSRATVLEEPPPPVIVRDSPSGPIVEGHLVEPDHDYTTPLPQRARTATATPPRPATDKPRPRPRPHATATMDPQTDDGTHTEPTEAAPETVPPATSRTPPTVEADKEDQPPAPAPTQRASSADHPSAADHRSAAGPSPSAGSPSAGSPSAGSPSAGSPSAGSASAGSPSAGSPSASSASPADHDPEIDLPLDGDPEPAPETQPAARSAVDDDIIAPPAFATFSPAPPDPSPSPSPSADRAARVLDAENAAPRQRARSADDDLLGDLEPPPWEVRAQQTAAAPGAPSATSDAPAAAPDARSAASGPPAADSDDPAPGSDRSTTAFEASAAASAASGTSPTRPSAAPRPSPEARPQQSRPRPAPAGDDAPRGAMSATGTTQPRSALQNTGLAAAAGAVVAAGMAAFGNAFRSRKPNPPAAEPAASSTASTAASGSLSTSNGAPTAATGAVSATRPAPTDTDADRADRDGRTDSHRDGRTDSDRADPADRDGRTDSDRADPGLVTPLGPPAEPAVAAPSAPPEATTTEPADTDRTDPATTVRWLSPPEPDTDLASTAAPADQPTSPQASAPAVHAVSSPDAPTASAPDSSPSGAAAAAGTATKRGRPWADLDSGFQPDERADDVITAYPSARPGPAGAIHGVGITVLVTDLARSVAFYREMLGFYEIDTGSGSAVLASGDTRLVLRTAHDLSTVAGRLISLNLEVGDVEASYEELKAKGVKFVHGPRPVNRGDKLELWAASFPDPDQHNIALTQWRAIR
jgi:catechol 2,3-dioxygenase-like lactoylglutathione lyase family enzyme